MKIAIIGVGAMGSVYAALLGDAGHEIWAIDTWQDHIDAIQRQGLRLEGASGERTVAMNAATDSDGIGHCDLVIIATKAMHVDNAAKLAQPLVGADTLVLTIQNGLGSADKVADALGRDRVAIGVVGGFGASMRAPGHAHHNGWELVRLGEFDGAVTPRLEAVADVWRSAGFKVKTFDDVHQLVWEKLICNVAFSANCAITEWTIGEVMAYPETWAVSQDCAREAYAVAKAKNITLDFDDPAAYVKDFGNKIPNAKPSMLLDILAERASEIDVINGAIPREGRTVEVATPTNDILCALVRAKEIRLGVRNA